MSYEKSVEFFSQWTREQGMDTLEFIMEVYSILRMYHPKKNTLYLQGTSNAGKTYVLESLVPRKDKVGQHITSRDFCFQECINKPVIMINELTLQNQTESEQYKNILGGEPTYINLKNRNAELLYRKPVFLTSNLPIWKFVSNDRQPLMNRMFAHMNLTASQVIKKYTTYGVPSTQFWRTAFQNINELEDALHTPKNENFIASKSTLAKYLTADAQTITDPDILLQQLKDCPLSPVAKYHRHNNQQESNSDSSTNMDETQPPEEPQENNLVDKSGQTGQSLMDTTPIEPTKMLPTNKREEQTQTQQITEIAYFDVHKDDKNNPLSAMNINANARHQSDDDTPDDDDLDFNLPSPPHIIISSDPASPDPDPDPDPDQDQVRRSPTQPFTLGRLRNSRLALRRRRIHLRHSTPTRPRRSHIPGGVSDTSESDNNNNTIDNLIQQL